MYKCLTEDEEAATKPTGATIVWVFLAGIVIILGSLFIIAALCLMK